MMAKTQAPAPLTPDQAAATASLIPTLIRATGPVSYDYCHTARRRGACASRPSSPGWPPSQWLGWPWSGFGTRSCSR